MSNQLFARLFAQNAGFLLWELKTEQESKQVNRLLIDESKTSMTALKFQINFTNQTLSPKYVTKLYSLNWTLVSVKVISGNFNQTDCLTLYLHNKQNKK